MKIMPLLKTALLTTIIALVSPAFADNTPVSDSAITKEINKKIAVDPLLRHSNLKVNVSTSNQIVTYSGVVNSDSEASTLVELAQSTVGVKDVDTSHLTVKGSSQPITDTMITAKVKGEFIKEKLFGDKDVSAWTIDVETNNGIVTLTGSAETKDQVKNAIKLAQATSGVAQVRYRVKITRGPIANYEMTNY